MRNGPGIVVAVVPQMAQEVPNGQTGEIRQGAIPVLLREPGQELLQVLAIGSQGMG